jgi:hypothetical protein
MFYRILLAPLFIVPMVGALVYVGTHPQRPISSLDPRSQGSFYDPVNIVSADGTRLEGWIIPLLDARAVIDRRDEVLTARAPAVILVHDHEAGRAQMLPLVAPLHEAGMVVLILGTRGEPTASVGSTFGINESADVLAAVDMLRRRPGVDPRRIGILGVGTGANAAMLAAARDRNITALVLDHPMQDPDGVLFEHLAPAQPWLQGLRPLCKWTFELAYQVDAEDLKISRHEGILASKPMLIFDANVAPMSCFRTQGISKLTDFLKKHLIEPEQKTPESAALETK